MKKKFVINLKKALSVKSGVAGRAPQSAANVVRPRIVFAPMEWGSEEAPSAGTSSLRIIFKKKLNNPNAVGIWNIKRNLNY